MKKVPKWLTGMSAEPQSFAIDIYEFFRGHGTRAALEESATKRLAHLTVFSNRTSKELSTVRQEREQLAAAVKKLSNDLEHKDRSLRDAYDRACQREANHKGEICNYEAVNNTNWLRLTQAERRADTAERRVKELEAKLEAVRLVIR